MNKAEDMADQVSSFFPQLLALAAVSMLATDEFF